MNALAKESSLYLQEHACNPVNWYPWAEEAWKRAKDEDKPIFLSIGYSACHWCHVMAKESFESEAIARILNDNFVSIKVDREEHPEVDEIYVDAVRLLTGSAGWPLSVFLTPDLVPFYGGSYFPAEPKHGLPSFKRVLHSVLHYYHAERNEVNTAGKTVVEELERLAQPAEYEGKLGSEPLKRFYYQHLETFDSAHGGFGTAPKFPEPADLMLLLLLRARPGFEKALPMAELTLKRMAEGGINDQLAGGFHRYSTDSVWLVPHFEKMLYDNALLAQTCIQAFQTTGKGLYRRTAEKTLDWLCREMRSPDGGFYASRDADTEEGEGVSYTWTRQELDSVLGSELAETAARLYGVTETGNFHGRNVLHVAERAGTLCRDLGLSPAELDRRMSEIGTKLLAARDKRTQPRTDDKVLADWNGLALSAFARAGEALGEPRYLEAADRLARFIHLRLMDGNSLLHVRRSVLPDLEGQLADYAFVSQGFLDLYEATFDIRHLRTALALADRMLELFADPEGGFFSTAQDASGLVVRARSGFDGAIPAGGSIACLTLLRLARLTGRNDYERIAAATVRRLYPLMAEHPQAFGRMLAVLDYLLNPSTELVMFLPGESKAIDKLVDLARRRPDPYRTTVVVRRAEPDLETQSLIPLVRSRKAVDGEPTAYVCRNTMCLPPVKHTDELEKLLSESPKTDIPPRQ